LLSLPGKFKQPNEAVQRFSVAKHSQKQTDAEDKVDELCRLVHVVLEQNTIIAQRLAALDPSQNPRLAFPASSIESPEHNAPPVGEDQEFRWQRNAQGFAFEELLFNSRAYKMAARDNKDSFSVVSSAGRTASWSMLSGLSLSEISRVAILALPIYATDLNNKDDYDFETPTTDPSTQAADSSDQRVETSDEKPTSSARAWFKNLVRPSRNNNASEAQLEPQVDRVFAVDLRTSIMYANVAISLIDESGHTYIYGYIPVIVAKSGVFLKERGTDVEDIFATNGNPVRVRELQEAFDSQPRYGKGLVWNGYTVHDCASVVLRYAKTLPEPVVPYGLYDEFINGMQPHMTLPSDPSAKPRINPDKLIPIAQ
jgi:hypothetical protein